MTLEEEQRRRSRALHVRVTGLKDQDNTEEVKELIKMMGITTPTHTKAWRVRKRGGGKGETSKERALILRFPSIEVKKEFLKLFDVGIIYPILDNKWVSRVWVVPRNLTS